MARATTTAGSVCDLYLQMYDKIDPSDLDYAQRRNKLLLHLTQFYAWVFNYRNWNFTYTTGTVTITAGTNSAALPDDFSEFTKQGGFWRDASRTVRMVEKQIYEIERMRQGTQPIRQDVFAIYQEKFQIPYNASSTLVMPIFYKMRPESPLLDASILVIPDQYLHTVILPGLVPMGQRSKNDGRPDWQALLRSGLSQMCAVERPLKGEDEELPMYRKQGVW
jgi:hypothetical protein